MDCTEDDLSHERALRPKYLSEFTGQSEVCANLSIYIQAAKLRSEPLDHVLLHGPPGLGKTTLAQIIAKEMNADIKMTSGPMLLKQGDLAAILTNLKPYDVLFIDEIHRLHPIIEEILYSAMEDYKLDIMIGEGAGARSIRIDLAPFTLVGATTRCGLLTEPLRDRFGIPLRLQFYTLEELTPIIERMGTLLKTPILLDAAREIASRSRGTPRIAGRLLRRVRDFWTIEKDTRPHGIDKDLTESALNRLNVDPMGLDAQDLNYLTIILNHYRGGPVGIETLAAALCEERDTIEDIIEPYLIQKGLIQRTPRGRMLSPSAYKILKQEALPSPIGSKSQNKKQLPSNSILPMDF